MLTSITLPPPLIRAKLKDGLDPTLIHNIYPKDLLEGSPRPASVLIPLIEKDEEWHILLIRRTLVPGDFHSGQVAFPGGAQDPEDENQQITALRETEEEIGVPKSQMKILGQLNQFITISNFLVTPFIGILPWPYEFIPSENEVSRIFSIPLTWLASPDNIEIRERDISKNRKLSVTYFKEFDNEVLWGASANMMVNFLKTLDIR